jgi:hypothetical protein
MVRATRVAVATANSNGMINDRSRLVSSVMSTTVEIGPWVVAARTAAAPSTANNPGGHTGPEPGPCMPPSAAPSRRRRSGKVRTNRRALRSAQYGRGRLQNKEDQKPERSQTECFLILRAEFTDADGDDWGGGMFTVLCGTGIFSPSLAVSPRAFRFSSRLCALALCERCQI